MTASEASIGRVAARAYKIPTDAPEADGTFGWDSTVLVLVEVEAGGETGLGYTYSDASIAVLVEHALTPVLTGRSAFEIGGANAALWRKVRNFGRSGLVATAISALDAALWDLKAKLLALAVASLLGRRRDRVPIYGSGGFTTYSDERLARQLSGWIEQDGCCWVKMKIGSEPERDPARIEAARRAVGEAGLFVDANGAYTPKQALELAKHFAPQGVAWLSGPVVDVLQSDMSRCGGVTGFLQAAALCAARHLDLSGHGNIASLELATPRQ